MESTREFAIMAWSMEVGELIKAIASRDVSIRADEAQKSANRMCAICLAKPSDGQCVVIDSCTAYLAITQGAGKGEQE